MEDILKVIGKDKSEGKRSEGKYKEKVKLREIGIKENKKDEVRERSIEGENGVMKGNMNGSKR